MKKKMFTTTLLVFLLVAGFACSLPSYPTNPAPTQESIFTLEPNTTSPTASPTNTKIDCNEDMACFKQALQNCQPAQVLFSTSIDFFGMLSTSTISLQSQEKDVGTCSLHLKTESVDLTYSDEILEQLKASGMTDAQIEEQHQTAMDALESGMYDDTCIGMPADFIALLDRWESGHFTSDDFTPFSCSGKILSNSTNTFEVTVVLPTIDLSITESTATPDPNQPEGYIAQNSYEGDCVNRPENTACLAFSDGYIWLVDDPYIQERDQNFGEWQGHAIVMITAPKNSYYHILTTNYIKEVSGIEGYTEQESYTESCLERPLGTTCLKYQDNFVWLISDTIQDWVYAGSWDNHAIYYGQGDHADYYHILETKYVKTVPK